MNTAKAEDSLIGALRRGFHSSLGGEGAMPDLDGANGWLNSVPLSRKSLRGKVVLANFWTYTCINSLRLLPYAMSRRSECHHITANRRVPVVSESLYSFEVLRVRHVLSA